MSSIAEVTVANAVLSVPFASGCFASSFAVVLKGLTSVGASPAQAASGLMALAVAMGACAINGGLPAERNRFDLREVLNEVYRDREGLGAGSTIPNAPELPLLLRQVRPIHEVVHVDYFLPGCPPSADAFWSFLNDLMAGRTPHLVPALLHYD